MYVYVRSKVVGASDRFDIYVCTNIHLYDSALFSSPFWPQMQVFVFFLGGEWGKGGMGRGGEGRGGTKKNTYFH